MHTCWSQSQPAAHTPPACDSQPMPILTSAPRVRFPPPLCFRSYAALSARTPSSRPAPVQTASITSPRNRNRVKTPKPAASVTSHRTVGHVTPNRSPCAVAALCRSLPPPLHRRVCLLSVFVTPIEIEGRPPGADRSLSSASPKGCCRLGAPNKAPPLPRVPPRVRCRPAAVMARCRLPPRCLR